MADSRSTGFGTQTSTGPSSHGQAKDGQMIAS
jgi:hypothetical protein